MAKSNYDITKEKMQTEFLKYDQEKMIEKFCLKHDKEYLYIRFIGRDYRVSRTSGRVEWSEDGFLHCTDGNYNEAMSIFDVLCYSKEGCHLSGRFSRINNMKGTVHSSGLGESSTNETALYFDGREELLRRACQLLGGTEERIGEVAYRIPAFDFLPVILQFWHSDEEFPPSLQILWDENILSFMHYETTYYTAGHLMERLRELMEVPGSLS